MSEFKGSISQVNVQFPIETVIEPISGENYSRAVIFMHVDLAAANLPGVTSPVAGSKTEIDSSSYGTTTGDMLKKWLTPFFTSAQAAKVAVVLYDTDTTDTSGEEPVVVPATFPLSDAYEKVKYWGYFKFGFTTYENEVSVQKELGLLCLADPLYSDFWVGTSDANVLTKSSTLISQLKAAGINARVIYNPDANINPALSQLGDTLATVNDTRTPIGNDIDGHGFSNGTEASGAIVDDERQNLTATEKAALDEQRIGYNTWVGDGTENVVTEGSLTLNGESVGSNWVKHYIEYMCKIRGANYITQRNKFRNNSEYQAVLSIVAAVAKPFVDFGRLAGFAITAPTYSKQAKSADSFVVPHAWVADYVDRLRTVTIYGTLYVTRPSK